MSNPKSIATKFLDQWERAHRASHQDYDLLAQKFYTYTGDISAAEADAVVVELHKGRKARGWPDPPSDSICPTIEGAIMSLWLRPRDRKRHEIKRAREQ